MSTQVLNDQTFTPARSRELAPEGAKPMTYGAVIVRALFLLILTAIAFVAYVWTWLAARPRRSERPRARRRRQPYAAGKTR